MTFTHKLYGDLETYSEMPIKNGTYAYAESAEILLFAWALDDGPVNVWDVASGEVIPAGLHRAIKDESTQVIFHNSMFDRSVLRFAMPDICPPIERWYDTMVQAMTHALPGSLAALCDILRVDADKVKDKRGKDLIQLFCKPRPKNSRLRRATRETHPEDWKAFAEYAKSDIIAMREVHKKLPAWNYRGEQLALWHLDQHKNDRGICVDLDFAHAAVHEAGKEKATLNTQAQADTDGAIASLGQRDVLLKYILSEYGVQFLDMQASTLRAVLEDSSIPQELRDLLQARIQVAMGATSKYKALINATNKDGRARGLVQYSGATRTRRDSGRTFQPQNLMRPPKYVAKNWDMHIEAIKDGTIDLLCGNVSGAVASTVRGCIVAAPGKKLVIADLSNIEGRGAADIAGESWKLQAFRDYDNDVGPDIYILAYARTFNTDVSEVDGNMRQIGKVLELSMQYQSGVAGICTFALGYGLDIDAMAELALPNLPDRLLREAASFYDWLQSKKGAKTPLCRKTFIVLDALKRAWREAHPAISSIWDELESCAVNAILSPGQTYKCRKLAVQRNGAWLRIRLPSGNYLCYPNPRADQISDFKWQISYDGLNQYTRKWGRIKTYGGKLFENVIQSYCRDIFKSAEPEAEKQGYAVVLEVHDELVTEVPDTLEFSAEGLTSIMATNPPWAPDIPLAAAGFECYRYRKG